MYSFIAVVALVLPWTVPNAKAAIAPELVLNSFAAASSQSDQQLRGSTMSIDITATVPRLDKTASLQGIRKVSSGGAVTYDSLQLSGDQSIRHEVIARYLSAEQNLGHERDLELLALNATNYKFHYRTVENLDGHRSYVFKVTPRHKREGSFDGDLWIDAVSYLPLRESGKIVQHSIFLRRLTMVRKFRIVDRMAVAESTDLSIDTRLVGKAQMTVKLHNVSLATQTGNLVRVTTVHTSAVQ